MALGIPYQINYTDATLPGKVPFVIQPGTTDGPLTPTTASPDSSATAIHTSIVLPGMGLVTYGERVAETLLHMLEHFASATPPVAPTIGQLWYDYGNEITKVWDGQQWAYVGSPWTYIASTDEYNAMVNAYNLIASTPSGTGVNAAGYNQVALPTLGTGVKPTPANWTTLYNSILLIAAHQNTTVRSDFVNTDFRVYADPRIQSYGIVTLTNWYQIWLAMLSIVSTNRFNVDPASLVTTVPASGGSTRTTQWASTIQHQVVYNFVDDAHMRAYFNAGGKISITESINSSAGAANAAWNTLYTGLGVVNLLATGVSRTGTMVVDTGHSEYTGAAGYTGANPGVVAGGFYALYNAGDNVQVKLMYAGLGAAIANYNGVAGLWILGSKNSANGTLTLTVQLVPTAPVGASANPATIQSSQTLTRPGPAHLNNPEVAYPAVTASILLTAGG